MSLRVVLIGDWFRKPVLSLVGLRCRRSYTPPQPHSRATSWMNFSLLYTFFFSLSFSLSLSLSFLVWRYAHNTIRYSQICLWLRLLGYFWQGTYVYFKWNLNSIFLQGEEIIVLKITEDISIIKKKKPIKIDDFCAKYFSQAKRKFWSYLFLNKLNLKKKLKNWKIKSFNLFLLWGFRNFIIVRILVLKKNIWYNTSWSFPIITI